MTVNKIIINCPADRLSAADQEIVALRLLGEYRTLNMEWNSKHRKHRIKYLISASDLWWYVDGFRTIVVFLSTGDWWIVADDPVYDLMFKDIGPFDTAEAALRTLKANLMVE